MEITTPNGTKVVLKDFITGRDVQKIQSVAHSGISVENGRQVINSNGILLAENKALEVAVISVNGETADILDKILDLPLKDYKFVSEEVKKIVEGDEEKKTN